MCKFTTGEMVPIEGSKLVWGPDIAPTVSISHSRKFSEINIFGNYNENDIFSEI